MRREEPFVGELTTYHKNGSTFLIGWRVDPMRDAEGRITHWVTIFR